MGVVHRVFDLELSCEVALKTLPTPSIELFYSLKEEFRAAADLVHPNLVRLYELFALETDCFFIMELVDGVSFVDFTRAGWSPARSAVGGKSTPISGLTARLSPRQWLPESVDLAPTLDAVPDPDEAPWSAACEDRFCESSRQLVDAIGVLHDSGRLHCDIKPTNVLVERDGRVVLLDFGLSWLVSRAARDEFVGTAQYVAPEQIWGRQLTPAADWYSFGVMLYEALTGRVPVDGTAQQVLLGKQRYVAKREELPSNLPERLAELVCGLLSVEPSQRPGRDDILRALASEHSQARLESRGPSFAFVGRERELARLASIWEQRGAHGLRVVQLHGESGIGKTELVRRFLAELDRETLTLSGSCRLQESVPFQALDHMVDELGEFLRSVPSGERDALLPPDFGVLGRVFPTLRRSLAQEPSPTDEDEQRLRQRASVALRTLLQRIASQRPLVLWIDDVQWGDRESSLFLRDLLGGGELPLLLLLTHPSGDASAESWISGLAQALSSSGSWVSFSLGPLAREAGEQLARSYLEQLGRHDEKLATRITTEAADAPLFIAQLAQLVGEGSPDPLTQAGDSSGLALVLHERLRRLERDELSLVRLVALAERPLAEPVLLRAGGFDRQARRRVGQLCASHFLRYTGRQRTPTVAIYHHKLREAILQDLDASERMAGHRQLAEALTALREPSPLPDAGFGSGVRARGGATIYAADVRDDSVQGDDSLLRDDDPEILYRHWLGAGVLERAGASALDAAKRAAGKLAFDHAAHFYQEALRLLPAGTPERLGAQRRHADMLALAGRCGEAGESYLELSRGASFTESLGLRQLAAEQFLIAGRMDIGLEVFKAALVDAGLSFPRSPRRALLLGVAKMLRFRLRGPEAWARLGAIRDGRAALQVDLCLAAAKGLSALDPAFGAYFAFSSLELARRAGESRRMGSALSLGGMMLAAGAGPPRAWGEAWLSAAAAIAEARHDRPLLGCVLICRAAATFMHAQWPETLRHGAEGARLLEAGPHATTWERNFNRMGMLRALEEVGEFARVGAEARGWQSDADARGDVYARATASLYLAFQALADDAPQRALAASAQGSAQGVTPAAPVHQFYGLRVDACAHLYSGQLELAHARADEACALASQTQLVRLPMPRTDMLLLRLRTTLRRRELLRHAGPSLDACERDCSLLDAQRRSDASAHAALMRGAIAQLRGAPSAALEQLTLAAALFSGAGMFLNTAYSDAAIGRVIGGAAGQRRTDAAVIRIQSKGIARPDRWLSIHAPGFGFGDLDPR
jgi:serine/threonine protein kinase